MAFPFALHPEAVKAFGNRATRLVTAFEQVSVPSAMAPVSLAGSAAHLPIATHLGPGDFVTPPRAATVVDPATGDLVELTFAGASGIYRLNRDDSTELSRLARAVAARVELRDACDAEFVQNSLFRWLQEAVKAQPSRGWIEALSDELCDAVQDTTFRVPLVGLVIEEPFVVGPYRVTYFSRRDIDDRIFLIPEEHRLVARNEFERHYQGKICVEGRVTAVPSRAESFALEAAEDVVRGLRFIHPAAVDIAINCRIGIYDCKRPRIPHVVLKTASGYSSRSGVEESDGGIDFSLSRHDLGLLVPFGLGAVSRYLGASARSELNEAAWGALGIFVRGVESTLWRDRLINALVAAETLLLRNSAEPIQRSLGQRMAVLLGGTLPERKGIIEDVECAYRARSAFIHHGEDIAENREPLSRVSSACRQVVHYCLANQSFRTKQDLIQRLDDQLLSGGVG